MFQNAVAYARLSDPSRHKLQETFMIETSHMVTFQTLLAALCIGAPAGTSVYIALGNAVKVNDVCIFSSRCLLVLSITCGFS